jgi:hypothetical protein
LSLATTNPIHSVARVPTAFGAANQLKTLKNCTL